MKKHRKPYRPKYGTRDDIAARLAMKFEQVADTNRAIHPDDANTVELQLRSALQAITSGEGTTNHAAMLATEVSLCMTLCEKNFAGSRQYLDLAIAARDALTEMGHRQHRTQKWGVTGAELSTLRDFLALRAAQYHHEDNTVGIEKAAQAEVYAAVKAGNYVKFLVEDAGEAVAA